jgi:catechol 2,3-dioxygenase-like lactoylglutathione lyase family enzyme
MELGAFSVSLAVKDIQASKTFYEKFGFTAFLGDASQNWLIMKNGDHVIGLFRLCARIRRTGGLMGFRWHGGFRYTAWFEKQRLDKDSGLAGLPGVSERDRRTGQDAETMGAAEVWQVGLLRVRPERARDRRSL